MSVLDASAVHADLSFSSPYADPGIRLIILQASIRGATRRYRDCGSDFGANVFGHAAAGPVQAQAGDLFARGNAAEGGGTAGLAADLSDGASLIAVGTSR